MRFTAARVANHHNICRVMNKLAACQFLQEQRRDRVIELGTIKFFQGLQVREPGCFQPPPVLVFLPGCVSAFMSSSKRSANPSEGAACAELPGIHQTKEPSAVWHRDGSVHPQRSYRSTCLFSQERVIVVQIYRLYSDGIFNLVMRNVAGCLHHNVLTAFFPTAA